MFAYAIFCHFDTSFNDHIRSIQFILSTNMKIEFKRKKCSNLEEKTNLKLDYRDQDGEQAREILTKPELD